MPSVGAGQSQFSVHETADSIMNAVMDIKTAVRFFIVLFFFVLNGWYISENEIYCAFTNLVLKFGVKKR
jgi:hypothetical protein